MKWFKHFRKLELIPKVTPKIRTDEDIIPLFGDGRSELFFDRDEELAGGLHQLILTYPGGWQDIQFTKDDWELMKTKVDQIFIRLENRWKPKPEAE